MSAAVRNRPRSRRVPLLLRHEPAVRLDIAPVPRPLRILSGAAKEMTALHALGLLELDPKESPRCTRNWTKSAETVSSTN